MYEIIETANGWILQPRYYDRPGMARDCVEVYVFNDVENLASHLKATLKTLSHQKDEG